MPRIVQHDGDLVSPIDSLEKYFRDGGVSIIQAAFAHTYFVDPDAVRNKTPYFPDRARQSREHYPGLNKGQSTNWQAGDGRPLVLDDNSRAQMAWERYTGSQLSRGSGYGVRHIWGNTHNPEAFTAGWNICYMPFWAGMLTEEQHPHSELQKAVRQASWFLFFAENPVCQPPGFVHDPQLDLDELLAGTPLLVLRRDARKHNLGRNPRSGGSATLPITMEPPDSHDFKTALLTAKKAWLQVSYTDGRKEVRPWDAQKIKPSSNVLGNLRSKREFRAANWQKNGIASLRVTIEHPASTGRFCGSTS